MTAITITVTLAQVFLAAGVLAVLLAWAYVSGYLREADQHLKLTEGNIKTLLLVTKQQDETLNSLVRVLHEISEAHVKRHLQ